MEGQERGGERGWKGKEEERREGREGERPDP